MNRQDVDKYGKEILDYCEKFNIPKEYLLEILEDQKVVPMIRGKATEYNVFMLLDDFLPKAAWSVQKLNLNAQNNTHDEDVSITHRRTGVILKVESKNAVRGGFRVKTRINKVPHFRIKCHRSRSNIKLAKTSNDRYSVDSFDLVVSNVSNALIQGNTVSERLEVLHDDKARSFLLDYYQVDCDDDLLRASSKDWRFAVPTDIAEDGFIPRTPLVLLDNDPNWFKLKDLEAKLLKVVKLKRDQATSSRRS